MHGALINISRSLFHFSNAFLYLIMWLCDFQTTSFIYLYCTLSLRKRRKTSETVKEQNWKMGWPHSVLRIFICKLFCCFNYIFFWLTTLHTSHIQNMIMVGLPHENCICVFTGVLLHSLLTTHKELEGCIVDTMNYSNSNRCALHIINILHHKLSFPIDFSQLYLFPFKGWLHLFLGLYSHGHHFSPEKSVK